MVSYADMITIMMAFFVVMYAMAPKRDKEEAQSPRQRMMDSLYERFGPEFDPFGSLLTEPRPSKHIHNGYGKLVGDPPRSDQKEKVTRMPAMVRIPGSGNYTRVGGMVRFQEGTTELADGQLERLDAMAREFAGKPQKVEVIGHASRRPLPAGSPYRDHFDLAYARARKTMEMLEKMGIDPQRMRVASAGSTEPLPPEPGANSLDQNSRVEAYIIDVFAWTPVGLAASSPDKPAAPIEMPAFAPVKAAPAANDAHGAH